MEYEESMLRFVCVVDTPRDLVCGGGRSGSGGAVAEEKKGSVQERRMSCVLTRRERFPGPCFARALATYLLPQPALARPALAPALRAHRHGRLELPPPYAEHSFTTPPPSAFFAHTTTTTTTTTQGLAAITSARGSSMSRSCLSSLCVPILRLSLQRCAPFLGLPAASYHCSQQ